MSRTICIPSLALNYEDNLLESVGIGGELYYRKQRDWHAIARSHEQTIERVGAENVKLRDLALNCYRMAKAHCTDKDCRTRCSHWPECYEHDSLQHAEPCELAVLACELGIEVPDA